MKDLTILIPALNEARNLRLLLPELRAKLDELGLSFEILVVDGGSVDDSQEVARQSSARFIRQTEKGYGGALTEGFAAAQGEYVLTMDADYSHEPSFVGRLWDSRTEGDMLIASRYVAGGTAEMSPLREALSRILNSLYRTVLKLPYRDFSSGFRLYRVAALSGIDPVGRDFDFLPELLAILYTEGFRIRELPFRYRPRQEGRSHAKLVRFGWAFARTLFRMWKLRNSIASADYDDRAFHSLIPLQRYWQRKRYQIIMSYLRPDGQILDVGCGSSNVVQALPAGVGVDVQLKKLRYLRGRVPSLLAGTLTHLPFRNGSFKQVVCSEVIEHVPKDKVQLSEFHRVLAPGGALVLGTPDYSSWIWRTIERLYALVPGSYAHEHINHYTKEGLLRELEENGFTVVELKTICRSEMIFKATKK